MPSPVSTLRALSAVALLIAASLSMLAFAQAAGTVAPENAPASAPGPVERAENATKKAAKATVKAGGKALDATKKAAKKAADAIKKSGKKIDAKISRVKADKSSEEGQAKPNADAR